MGYNGWKNYATWRVNLEYFDQGHYIFDDQIRANRDVSDLAASLREFVEDSLEQEGEGQVLSYALAFLQECSYFEIADHIIQDWEDVHCTNCDEEIDGYDEYCSKRCKDEYELLATHPKG
tara:strand:+ start:3316 stop:3675 length:360 start_codon:yes stop_codon:yes gene_type:complete